MYQACLIKTKEERFAAVTGGKDELYVSSKQAERVMDELLAPGKERREWLKLLGQVRRNTVRQEEPELCE